MIAESFLKIANSSSNTEPNLKSLRIPSKWLGKGARHVPMMYIRRWMQMVYRHMIYSPETDKQAWQSIMVYDVLATSTIFTLTDNGHLQIHYRKLIDPHSVHAGSSLSRLTLLPARLCCCLLPCWRLTAYLAPCPGGRAPPRPPHLGWPHFP
jgi:hypothetical protein